MSTVTRGLCITDTDWRWPKVENNRGNESVNGFNVKTFIKVLWMNLITPRRQGWGVIED
jgi:hypothetical protein